MRVSLILSVVISLFLFCGCTLCTVKKIPCSGYQNAAFDGWFPYTAGDRLLYKNLETADTFSYVISTVSVSEPYEASSGGYGGGDLNCSASKEIRNVNNGGLEAFFSVTNQVTTYFNNGPVEQSLFIYFRGGRWTAGAVNEQEIQTGLTNETLVGRSSNVVFENGITYPLMTTLEIDTVVNKSNAVYKLYIAKDAGIVGFETYPAKQKWIIQ